LINQQKWQFMTNSNAKKEGTRSFNLTKMQEIIYQMFYTKNFERGTRATGSPTKPKMNQLLTDEPQRLYTPLEYK